MRNQNKKKTNKQTKKTQKTYRWIFYPNVPKAVNNLFSINKCSGDKNNEKNLSIKIHEILLNIQKWRR